MLLFLESSPGLKLLDNCSRFNEIFAVISCDSSYSFTKLFAVFLIANVTVEAQDITRIIMPIKIFLPLFLVIEIKLFFKIYILLTSSFVNNIIY